MQRVHTAFGGRQEDWCSTLVGVLEMPTAITAGVGTPSIKESFGCCWDVCGLVVVRCWIFAMSDRVEFSQTKLSGLCSLLSSAVGGGESEPKKE